MAEVAAKLAWKARRRLAGEAASFARVTGRKYGHCASKAVRKRTAQTRLPNRRVKWYRCFAAR